jgi:hypothetical protein
MAKPKVVRKPMSEVCNLMGKKCSGPIIFYLNTETGKLGISISKRLNEAETGEEYGMEGLLTSQEFADIDSQLTVLDSIPNRVIIQCPVEAGVNDPKKSMFNIDVDNINPKFLNKEKLADSGEYPIQKDFHARHIIYTFKFPNAKEFVQDIRTAFVLAVLFEDVNKKGTSLAKQPAEEASPTEKEEPQT